MRLSGKNILVVGVGPGLGTATAYMLLKDGANVAAVARKEERLEKVKETLSDPANLLCIAADASSMEGAQKITKAVAEKFDGVDGIALYGYPGAQDSLNELIESWTCGRYLENWLGDAVYVIT
ncbi:MAG: SDR family NAD(P)-dependent oxidoreductase [Candidatus Marsarchaeota archaeon]|jgi:NAD(P)-dependent dehydrogenase (short-subunit alcohol dehydrogenase family)|nr:SDR family NAD(P)-dependent oxidoreductase [Candidatus Marsarchaeota archaeon]